MNLSGVCQLTHYSGASQAPSTTLCFGADVNTPAPVYLSSGGEKTHTKLWLFPGYRRESVAEGAFEEKPCYSGGADLAWIASQ